MGPRFLFQMLWNTSSHSTELAGTASTLLASKTDKSVLKLTLKELLTKASLASVFRELLKMNLHYSYLLQKHGEKKTRGICMTEEGGIIQNNSGKSKFLK